MNVHSNTQPILVKQGQWEITTSATATLSCLLGSCVAACIRDPGLRIGGMNHFLLPGHDPRDGGNVRYGARSMEELINALLRKGADRNRLEVSLFGGANVLGGATGIGASNATFAMDFVRTEGFKLLTSDLGGTAGRRVSFHPASGEIKASTMQSAPVAAPPPRAPVTEDIELF